MALALTPALAAAQQKGPRRVDDGNGDGMDTHLFRPALDSKGFFGVNGSDIVGANDVSFGLVLDYGRELMRTNSDRTATATAADRGVTSLARDSFQGTFAFNYGIANRLVLGLTVPVVLMAGDEANEVGRTGAVYSTGKLDAQEMAGMALHGKLRLTRVEKGIGIAILVQGGIPFGHAPQDLAADPGFWYWPQLVLENQFGASRRFKIGLNGGYRGHTGKNPEFGLDPDGRAQLAEGPFAYGNLATFGLGLSYRVLDPLDLVAETYGTYLLASDADSKQKLSQEVIGGMKVFVERNSYLMMGAGSRYAAASTGFEAADVRMVLGFVFEPSIGDRDGDGLKDDEDQCPDEPEDFDGFNDKDGCPDPDNDNDGILDVDDRCPNIPEDFDGDQDQDGCPEGSINDRDGDGIPDNVDQCPDEPEDKDGFEDKDGCPDPDNDKDGIPDTKDQCPNDPEDMDGFEDEDGCPDPDNDKDGILDSVDKCPNEPETFNGFEDEDGCPDKGRVIIEGSDIVILDKVQFKTGSAEILPQSNAILDAVASTLEGHPEFKIIEIAGHADERSSDAHNLKLTKDRAHAVVEAVVRRGIARSRLVSQGYGEYCPLDPGHNAAAWEKNRRVEFKVVQTDDGDTDVERGCDEAKRKGVFPPPVK
ncbi:MAG: OmpA family protein [Sorangiineae bacterium]|nr:OmpA family protein [Polyangiaceae bacterium]MEB2321873.1 OmpA family protein [Sorangiineae bacterium]